MTSALRQQHDGSVSIGGHHATWQFLIKKGLLTFKELDTLTVFSVRRNPLDVVISDWVNDNKTLTKSIESRVLYGPFYWHNHFGTYIHYEDGLEIALNIFFQHLEIPKVKLPWKGKTKDKEKWFNYYTESEIQLLKDYTESII